MASRGQICRRHAILIVLLCLMAGVIVKQVRNTQGQRALPFFLRIIMRALMMPITIAMRCWQVVLTLAFVIYSWRALVIHKHRHRRRHSTRKAHNKPELFRQNTGFEEQDSDVRTMPFVFPENEQIESSFTEMLNSILLNHVYSWYSHISTRSGFPQAVERLIRLAIIDIKDRLENADALGSFVRRATPIFTQHLQDYATAEAIVKKLESLPSGSELEQNAIAQQYRGGHLHPAVSTGDATAEVEVLRAYVRNSVVKILLEVIPPSESRSPFVRIMMREILTCAVVCPILQLITDPDFWNQNIVTHAHQAIQERARVKRFRHVLKEQSRNPQTHKKQMKRKPLRNLERLMMADDPKEWDRLYRKIKKSQSLEDVTRMRREMLILKNELIASELDLMSSNRDNGLKEDRKKGHFLVKAMSLLEGRIALLSKGSGLESSGITRSISFDRLLTIGVSYFLEFLERRNRVDLLDFWHHVMAFKLTAFESIPESQLSILDSSKHLCKSDIAKLYSRFFSSPLLTVTDAEMTLINNYIENEPDTYDIDSNEIVVNVAKRAYRTMETEDFPLFRQDPLYLNMIAGESQLRTPLSRTTSSSTLERLPYSRTNTGQLTDLAGEYLQHETMGMLETGDSDVLEAMESALQTVVADTEDTASSSRSSFEESSVAALTALDTGSLITTEVITAAPGDLEISERIGLLNNEIREKEQSLKIIDQYTASRKNIDDNEIRVLNKSRAQIMVELSVKQNQKRQFELQNGEHDLYLKSTIRIEHTTTQRDADGEYVVYMVEVNRAGKDGLQAGWIILRRYSEFNELYNQLKARFPSVANVDFPKKQLNRLKSVSETRRPILEAFLRSLLEDERICQSREFRSFLSQHNEHVTKRKHKSVMENIISITDPREGLSRLFSMIDGSEDSKYNPDLRDVHPAPIDPHEDEVSSFAKPIVDFVLEVFDLRDRSKWIKKRAVVLVMQQFLGGTIESRIRDYGRDLVDEQSLCSIFEKVKTQMGDKSETTVHTQAEKQRLKELAQQTLKAYTPSYMPDTAGKKVFKVLQNRTLNLHIIMKLFDLSVDILSNS